MDHRAYRWVTIAAAGLLLTACPASPTPPAVLDVAIDQASHAVAIGHVEELTATVSVAGGADARVTWTSSAPDVARVVALDDRSAELTALAEGAADVTATSVADAAQHDTITVTVEEPTGEVIAVEIDQPGHTIWVGHPETFSATVTVTGGADPTVEWTHSNAEAAAISPIDDRSVTFTPLAPGDTVLTAISVADETKSDSVAITVAVAPVSPWSVDWTWSQGYGYGQDVAVGPGDRIAVVGTISELTPLPGQAPLGGFDAYVVVLDPDGDVAWLRQFGTTGEDAAHAVAFDAAGRVHVAGTSTGYGLFAAGDTDLFVQVFEPAGEDAAFTAFGSDGVDQIGDLVVQDVPGPSTRTTVVGAYGGACPGSAPIGGRDAFAMQLDGNLEAVWTNVFGTLADDAAQGAALDPAGNLWVVGEVGGALVPDGHAGGLDAFALRLGSDGEIGTTLQFGTAGWDTAAGVTIDALANATVVGSTAGTLFATASAGGQDAFAVSLDGTTTVRWADQFGTDADDHASAVAITPDGATTLVVGRTQGAFPGNSYVDAGDAFVRAYDTSTYDPHGRPIWTQQTGTSDEDSFSAVATDTSGSAIVAGYVSHAAYVVKLVP